MGSNAVIDVVIGLILMYLTLSVFCTIANEFLATILGWRAKSLAASIEQLIDDPALRSAFYNHGLIDSSKSVSTACSQNDAGHPSYLSGRFFAMALLGSLDNTKSMPGFADIEDTVKSLPNSNIRDVLLAHVVAVDKDLTKLRDGLAMWFDSAMDRLGGVYKRKLRYVSFCIGLIFAFSMNADTIVVGKALWHDGALRALMVKTAEHAATSASVAEPTDSKNLNASLSDIRVAEDNLRPLPIGWSRSSISDMSIEQGLIKLAGLLLTALALTLGAPFWFDLLSKFIRLRGTGDKPERTDAS